MRRKYFTVFLLVVAIALCTQPAYADHEVLILSASDGQEVLFEIDSKVTISKSNDGDIIIVGEDKDLIFGSDTKISIRKGIHSSNESVSALEEENLPIIKMDINSISISNINPNEIVAIYTVSGMLYTMANANADGFVNISTEKFPGGIYVITTSKISYKIAIK